MISLTDCSVFLDLGDDELNLFYENYLKETQVGEVFSQTNCRLSDFLENHSNSLQKVCVKFWQEEKSCEIIEEIKQNYPEVVVVVACFLLRDDLVGRVKKSKADGALLLLGASPEKIKKMLQTIVNNF